MAEVFKNAGYEAAKIAGRSPEMDITARKLAGLAREFAREHSDDGTFERSIEVHESRGRNRVRQLLVVATDPLAAVKEFGHVIRNEADGPVLGYVKGQHSMFKAMKAMPEDRGD